jgi:uncharacterized protein YjdB
VAEISLSSYDFTLVGVGDSYTLEAQLSPATSAAQIRWSSEDEKVATVNPISGLVTAVGSGWTRIECEAGGIRRYCTVYVSSDALAGGGGSGDSGSESSSVLSHDDVTIDSSTNETFTLTADGSTSGSYYSDDYGVADVDSEGTVTAISPGTANVTVTYNGTSYVCIVRVI